MVEPSPEICCQKTALDALAIGRYNWDSAISSIAPSCTLTFQELSLNLAPGNLFLHFKNATSLGKQNCVAWTASDFLFMNRCFPNI